MRVTPPSAIQTYQTYMRYAGRVAEHSEHWTLVSGVRYIIRDGLSEPEAIFGGRHAVALTFGLNVLLVFIHVMSACY